MDYGPICGLVLRRITSPPLELGSGDRPLSRRGDWRGGGPAAQVLVYNVLDIVYVKFVLLHTKTYLYANIVELSGPAILVTLSSWQQTSSKRQLRALVRPIPFATYDVTTASKPVMFFCDS